MSNAMTDATIPHMGTKAQQPDRHKPGRMVRIPETLAVALEQIADEQFNNLTEQVKTAVREYLERLGRLPKRNNPTPKR